MAKLIYTTIGSLDGYVNDADGNFDWAMPSDEVHAFVNDLERPLGTYLYGRKLYETMVFWETAHTLREQPSVIREYTQIWQAADKIVYSRTLREASSARTRIERVFDPAAVRAMKETGARDISIGGPGLAAHALQAGLVDELRLIVAPVVVGGRTRILPDDAHLDLNLLDERRFANGFVYLAYAIR